jgi:hypothetical protein
VQTVPRLAGSAAAAPARGLAHCLHDGVRARLRWTYRLTATVVEAWSLSKTADPEVAEVAAWDQRWAAASQAVSFMTTPVAPA